MPMRPARRSVEGSQARGIRSQHAGPKVPSRVNGRTVAPAKDQRLYGADLVGPSIDFGPDWRDVMPQTMLGKESLPARKKAISPL